MGIKETLKGNKSPQKTFTKTGKGMRYFLNSTKYIGCNSWWILVVTFPKKSHKFTKTLKNNFISFKEQKGTKYMAVVKCLGWLDTVLASHTI